MKRDRVSEHNRRMWDRLAREGIPYTRPQGRLPQTRTAQRHLLDPHRRLAGVRLPGVRVFVLAGGGGWDAVLFAKLGAETTLLDISRKQLDTVRRLARRARVRVRCVRGGMTDLSRFPDASFDVVWHCHSLVFVDNAVKALWRAGRTRVYAPTIEYAHRIETIVNGIVAAGMVVDGLWELPAQALEPYRKPSTAPSPGSDEHLESLFPAYIQVRGRKPRGAL